MWMQKGHPSVLSTGIAYRHEGLIALPSLLMTSLSP
jgi:hypothetical protein